MAYPHKTPERYMHEKPADKFNPGKRQCFPFSFLRVVFYGKCHIVLIHMDQAVVADCNPMGIFPKILDDRARILFWIVGSGTAL